MPLWTDRLVEGADDIHVGPNMSGESNRRAESGTLACIIHVSADHRYAGPHRDVIKARLPVVGALARAFGRDHQDEALRSLKVLDHVVDDVMRATPIDPDGTHPAEYHAHRTA